MATELAENQSGGGKAGVLALPFGAHAANRFAKAHGEVDYGLQALRGNGREISAKLSEKKLRIAEIFRQRIIDFVAQDLREIERQLRSRDGTEFKLDGLWRTQTALNKSRGDGKDFA